MAVTKIILQYKTKTGINNALVKQYPSKDNKQASEIYNTIKFYITVSTDITGNQDYATILRTKDLSGLMKQASEIYNTIKPLLGDKKGR